MTISYTPEYLFTATYMPLIGQLRAIFAIVSPSRLLTINTTNSLLLLLNTTYSTPLYPSLTLGIEFESLKAGVDTVTDAVVEAYESYYIK